MSKTAPISLPETSLVLLPGLDGTGELFAPALELDWGGMKPVVYPLPSTGPQDYESLAAWLAPRLPEGDLVLLAESFSTPLAMHLSNRLPGRIRALVLVSGFCTAPHSSGLGWLPIRPLFAVTPPAFFLKRFLTGEQAPPALLEQLAQVLQQTPGATLTERVRVVLAMLEDETPDPGELPILLLQASHDRLIPWEAQSRLERHFPDAEVDWVDGPHLLMQTRPQDCRDAVIGFLTATPTLPLPE